MSSPFGVSRGRGGAGAANFNLIAVALTLPLHVVLSFIVVMITALNSCGVDRVML
jgi:hypothetical protein